MRPRPDPSRVVVLLLAAGCGGSTGATGSTPAGAVVPDCRITDDGALTSDEFPHAVGLAALYVRNAPGPVVAFDPAGTPGEGGVPLWDFSAGPAEAGATFRLGDPADEGLSQEFPSAAFTLPAAVETAGLLGMYQLVPGTEAGSGELFLQGLATAAGTDPAQEWRLRYDSPVPALRFPLRAGDSWEARATFRDARFAGIPNQGVEDWRFVVDAEGTVRLPGDIEVEHALRVRVEVDRAYAVAAGTHQTSQFQYLWFAPCFGEVARVSGDDPSLSRVDELRRLVP